MLHPARHQKLVEEAPSSLLTPEVRRGWGGGRQGDEGHRVRDGRDARVSRRQGGKFYALEVNTRIQVEHTVTEMITGFDIIRKMYKIAAATAVAAAAGRSPSSTRSSAASTRDRRTASPPLRRITFLRQISGPSSGPSRGSTRVGGPVVLRLLLAKICSVGRTGTAIQGCGAPCGSTTSGRPDDDPAAAADHGPARLRAGMIHTGFIDENIAGSRNTKRSRRRSTRRPASSPRSPAWAATSTAGDGGEMLGALKKKGSGRSSRPPGRQGDLADEHGPADTGQSDFKNGSPSTTCPA